MDKSKVIDKLFAHIVTYSYLLLPLIFLIGKYRSFSSIIIAIYGIVFWFLLFVYSYIPKELRITAYQPIYTTLEYLFFTSLFYINLKREFFKKILIVLTVTFILFQIIYVLNFEKNRVDSIPIGVESILIFVYIFLFFYESLNNVQGEFIYYNPYFWISAGLLFYLGGSFFINILANSFSDEEFSKYWFLNYIADTFKTFLFAIGLILMKRKSFTSNSKISSTEPYLDMI